MPERKNEMHQHSHYRVPEGEERDSEPEKVFEEIIAENIPKDLPSDPAVPLLGVYLEKTMIQRDTFTPKFICIIFIDSEYQWYHTIFTFLFLTYFTK